MDGQWIVGVDEVGRGCLAGPVVTAAVILHPDTKQNSTSLFSKIRDSKLVPESERTQLAEFLKANVRAYAIAEASIEEITELNILHASMLAMERAVFAVEKQMERKADHVLVDGNRVPPGLKKQGHALVKGDLRSLTIASASLIAKVHRDEMMKQFESEFPGYGLAQHKGYPTPFHKSQIQVLGITRIHRPTFKGVAVI